MFNFEFCSEKKWNLKTIHYGFISKDVNKLWMLVNIISQVNNSIIALITAIHCQNGQLVYGAKTIGNWKVLSDLHTFSQVPIMTNK